MSPAAFPADAPWSAAAAGLVDGIETGRFEPGELLGASEDIANACCVTRDEIGRALDALAASGYVIKRGLYYVVDDPPRRQPPRF